MELNEQEKEENKLFLETVQSSKSTDTAELIVQVVMEHFKFGYGGYNGWFNDRAEMMDEIRAYIKCGV